MSRYVLHMSFYSHHYQTSPKDEFDNGAKRGVRKYINEFSIVFTIYLITIPINVKNYNSLKRGVYRPDCRYHTTNLVYLKCSH